jgi:hypothetical protein
VREGKRRGASKRYFNPAIGTLPRPGPSWMWCELPFVKGINHICLSATVSLMPFTTFVGTRASSKHPMADKSRGFADTLAGGTFTAVSVPSGAKVRSSTPQRPT